MSTIKRTLEGLEPTREEVKRVCRNLGLTLEEAMCAGAENWARIILEEAQGGQLNEYLEGLADPHELPRALEQLLEEVRLARNAMVNNRSQVVE